MVTYGFLATRTAYRRFRSTHCNLLYSIDKVSWDAFYANVPPGASSDRGSSTYEIRGTVSAAISCNVHAAGIGIWKAVFGTAQLPQSFMPARRRP